MKICSKWMMAWDNQPVLFQFSAFAGSIVQYKLEQYKRLATALEPQGAPPRMFELEVSRLGGGGGPDFNGIPDRHKRMAKSSSSLVVPSVIHRNLLILMCLFTLPTTMISGYSFLLDQHRLSRTMFWAYTSAKIAEVWLFFKFFFPTPLRWQIFIRLLLRNFCQVKKELAVLKIWRVQCDPINIENVSSLRL